MGAAYRKRRHGDNRGPAARSFAGVHVIAVVRSKDVDYVGSLGASEVIDNAIANFADAAGDVNVVIDTVGGETRERAFGVLKPGGILVTVVSGELVSPRSDVRSARENHVGSGAVIARQERRHSVVPKLTMMEG